MIGRSDPLISALLSSLLPGDGDWPSAAATGLPAWFGRRVDASPALAEAVGWLRIVLPADFAIRAPSLRQVDLKGCEEADPARFAVVVTEAVSGYYIDPKVLGVVEAKTGFPARPPQPMGHRLEPFDFAILEGRKRPASDRQGELKSMSNASWYEDAIIIDGLNASSNGPNVFDLMRKGGLTAVHVTHVSPYARLPDTMKSLALWKKWFRDHSEKIFQVYTTADIHRAKKEGRLGVIIGWQDCTGIDDHLYNIALYAEMGIRFIQMTYNTANGIGTGCYDSFDAGLTDFGCEVVEELNRCGIAVDLSHCSSKTASDAIRVAKKPVCYTHIAPSGLCDVPRNKTDEDIRLMAQNGAGYVGVSLHPFLLAKGNDSELDDYIDCIEYVNNLVGEDLVGIGTDFFEGVDMAKFAQTMTRRDKYHARVIGPPIPNTLRYPSEMPSIAALRNIVPALERRKWSETRIRKLLGENFLAYLGRVWAA